jgi:hypothetical protein
MMKKNKPQAERKQGEHDFGKEFLALERSWINEMMSERLRIDLDKSIIREARAMTSRFPEHASHILFRRDSDLGTFYERRGAVGDAIRAHKATTRSNRIPDSQSRLILHQHIANLSKQIGKTEDAKRHLRIALDIALRTNNPLACGVLRDLAKLGPVRPTRDRIEAFRKEMPSLIESEKLTSNQFRDILLSTSSN